MDGDPAAISDLIMACQPDLLKFARQACATPEDAEDAVQETLWLISSKGWHAAGVNAFMGWAIRIVKHECFRLLKSRAWRKRVHWMWRAIFFLMQEDLDLPKCCRDDLVNSLDAIAAHVRGSACLMRDVQEMTAPEVASVLHISSEAVKSRLHRARGMLRSQLKHWGNQ